ncbi:MAG TPA: amidohydrolase [Rectinemataceae bacterium]|nr:amidohydrolase [Rectinemataceae bacterium]
MKPSLPGKIVDRIHEMAPSMIRLRHRLHGLPELKFEERGTMAIIRDFAAGCGVELMEPLIGTDTVALLRGGRPGPTVLLRADIDALPIQDCSGRPWSSAAQGRSHACGHDGHMAMLLGAMKVAGEFASDLAGNIRFVFQPAEEEIGGGKALIEKGLLELEPKANVAFAFHGWSGLPAGKISCAPGPAMAAADSFSITIKGKGGHGGMPHEAIDPVVAAAQSIIALQTIASRNVDPLKPVVISVCSLHGGSTRNVIPDEVVLEGTIRYFDKELRDYLRDKMRSVVSNTCAALGCANVFTLFEGYIPTINDRKSAETARSIIISTMGEAAWSEDFIPSMGTEDFAYYLDRIPGAFMRLGLGKDWPRLHNPAFDFNDQALEAGMTALLALAFGYDEASKR